VQVLQASVPTEEQLKLALTFMDDLALPDSVLLLAHAPAASAAALLPRVRHPSHEVSVGL
jgi:hypothetical protein